jgi:hypothetical protein
MTVPARVKQADIARALREAQKIGAKRVKIGADGSIDIVLETEEQAAAPPNGRHDEPLGPIRIRDRPKKKVGSYSDICWYGPFPIAPLIQVGGSSLSPQASRARRQPR